MIFSSAIVLATLATPPTLPAHPVVISTDKAAYVGKEQIVVSLRNNNAEAVQIAPHLVVDRSEGDGTFTKVYKLWAVAQCPAEPPPKRACVTLKPGETLTLPPWDWNTGGTDQCPPRRPGHRAFKGVHRLIADWCPGKAPKNARPRIKLVTWE